MLCDHWPGIDDCFEPEEEILIAEDAKGVVDALRCYSDKTRKRIGAAFRARALRDHTYAQRAAQAEVAILQSIAKRETVASEMVARV